MHRLVVNPGTQQASELQLKTGTNSFGRGEANDFRLNDPSVSGSHCQIVVDDGSATLRDLGSTNGTYVAGQKIQERRLEDGHSIRLGNVEMVYCAGRVSTGSTVAAVEAIRVAARAVAPPVPPPVPSAASPARISVSVAKPAAAATAPEASAATEVITAEPQPVMVGERYCKFHRKSPARFWCEKCDVTYCDLCIQTTEIAGRNVRTCRACGAEVFPAQFQRAPGKGFYAKLPGAFVYPFKGAGSIILLCATIAFAALHFVGGGIFGWFIQICLYGFVFLFMQNIILVTTSDESDDLCFPNVSSLTGAAFQLAGTVIASFWLAIGLAIAKFGGVDLPTQAIMGAVILGGIYFPMALLAVAMKDTVMAANPLIVVPAMLKAPGKYSVTVILLLGVFGVRQLGDMISSGAGSVALWTHNNSAFAAAVAYQAVWALMSVYLLTVTMRLLGLFYNGSKRQLGWFKF